MSRDSPWRQSTRRHPRSLWAVLSLALAVVSYARANVTYRELHLADGPWEVQVVEFERDSASLRLGVALAAGQVHGREPLDKMVELVSTPRRRAIAAITGDFFKPDGDPVGLCIVGGELISTPNSRVALAILDDGTPVIDRFGFVANVRAGDGTTLRLDGVNQACPEDGVVLLTRRFDRQSRASDSAGGPSVQVVAGPLAGPLRPNEAYTFTVTATLRGDAAVVIDEGDVVFVGRGAGAESLASFEVGQAISCDLRIEPSHGDPSGAIAYAAGGAGRLLRDGEVATDELAKLSPGFGEMRHPRTAFGFNDERAFFVTVDGRQPGYSIGMSLLELAELLQELGATEGINLDGGGSTTMWAEGEIKNRPSDGGPRPIANALVVYQIVNIPHATPPDR